MRVGRRRHFVLATSALFLAISVCPDVVADAKATNSSASTSGKVSFFADQLANNDDFRVRTNAALALGATNDDAAVPPLCGALSDPSEVVRQAAGVAISPRSLRRARS